MPAGPVVFAADLIPGRPWVHLPITMGYDRYPELLIDEKAALLTDLVARTAACSSLTTAGRARPRSGGIRRASSPRRRGG